ncbi:MAG: CinA family nicotinamide mononucleotide deamidase-related protein [Pirellulales bacterium]
MLAEIISIGDELTSGQRLDTNSQWLALRLSELGVVTGYHTTVADDQAANVRVLREAFERADLIISTGGLGPTADDLTRQALAESVGVELELDVPSLEHIQSMFARRQREMPPANRVQALFPRGSRIVPNPHGTAPGIDLTIPRGARQPARIFCLPGVPAEMKEMWNATVAPAIQLALGPERRVIRQQVIKCFGVGESDLERMLPDLIRRGRDPQVGITVSQATISLRITAVAESPAACEARIAPTVETIYGCLGNLVYGTGDEELQHVVVRRLGQLGRTVATIESGTRGLLAWWLGNTAGDSGVYRGGQLIHDRRTGPDSAEAAAAEVVEWAQRARTQFSTDFGLAVGPFPPPAEAAAAAGQVHVALASPTAVKSFAFSLAGHPDILLSRTAKQALNVLRLELAAE